MAVNSVLRNFRYSFWLLSLGLSAGLVVYLFGLAVSACLWLAIFLLAGSLIVLSILTFSETGSVAVKDLSLAVLVLAVVLLVGAIRVVWLNDELSRLRPQQSQAR